MRDVQLEDGIVYIDLDRLTASERRHLKETFMAIDRHQKATEQRLATGHLG